MQWNTYYNFLFITVAVYFAISIYIFNRLNKTIDIVIDEQFHIPQGKAYCEGNFTHWDNKITTLPGLYLVSSAVKLISECTTYNLRLVNLIASVVNLLLFTSIIDLIYNYKKYRCEFFLQALNLAMLPPLYFFSHIYYTDTMSLMFLLAFSKATISNYNIILIFILGVFSVLMRQTNIVWILLLITRRLLFIYLVSSRVYKNAYKAEKRYKPPVFTKKIKSHYNLTDLYYATRLHLSTYFKVFFRFLIPRDWVMIFTHALLLGSFMGFVYWNGSIVLGDKSAHEAVLHIPQMFYFLIFYGVFSLPLILSNFLPTLKLINESKLRFVLLLVLFNIIVHYNTLVHPYLLADNRHYTFYVWNRWFGKYDFAIYASTPIYAFLLYSLYYNLNYQNCISFLLPYTVGTFIVLSLQKMIEIRYFFVPYIIIKLRLKRPSTKIIVLETIWYLALNALTFYIFFHKEVKWTDFDYSQRIIW